MRGQDRCLRLRCRSAAAARELCPAPCTEEDHHLLDEAVLKLHHALDLSVYSRTDFILDAEGCP